MIEIFFIQLIAFVFCNLLWVNAYFILLEKSILRSFLRSLLFLILSSISLINADHIWASLTGASVLFITSLLFDHKLQRNIKRFLFLTAGQFLIIFFLFAIELNWISVIRDLPRTYDLQLDKTTLQYATAFLFCLAPSNIFIKAILEYLRINVPFRKDSLKRGGRFIGNLERVITLTLVIKGQYEAIGLIIAAKSILRSGSKEAEKEYLVIGNLLSFGIAIIIGSLLLWSTE